MTGEERNRVAAKQRMIDKHARGECRSCPNPTEPGKSRCVPCRLRHGISQRAWRSHSVDYTPKLTAADAKLLAHGRCARCHLLNPCVCLPTIQELAAARRDGGSLHIGRADRMTAMARSGG